MATQHPNSDRRSRPVYRPTARQSVTHNHVRFTTEHHPCVDTVDVEPATREALLESGLAHQYMFDQLADRNNRKSSDENGDEFRLVRRAKGLFKLNLTLLHEPRMPFGFGKKDPYDTDISAIFERLAVDRRGP